MAESTTADIGLRERKKIETRRLIRSVALDLMIEGGLENVTVEAIVDRAGVSRRTFFNYFDRKEDALVADASAAADTLRRKIIERPADETPLHAIRAVVTELDIFALMDTDRDRMLARYKVVQQHPVLMARQLSQHLHMEQALADAVAERLGVGAVDAADDLRPSLIAGVAVSAIRIAMQWWSVREHENLIRVLTTAFDLLENGLLTPPQPVDGTTSPASTGPGATGSVPRERGQAAHE